MCGIEVSPPVTVEQLKQILLRRRSRSVASWLSPERQLKLLCVVNEWGRVDRDLDVRDKGVFMVLVYPVYSPPGRRRPRPAAGGRGRGEHLDTNGLTVSH
jgi:hypothetical protein